MSANASIHIVVGSVVLAAAYLIHPYLKPVRNSEDRIQVLKFDHSGLGASITDDLYFYDKADDEFYECSSTFVSPDRFLRVCQELFGDEWRKLKSQAKKVTSTPG